jgi:hypothetical protein
MQFDVQEPKSSLLLATQTLTFALVDSDDALGLFPNEQPIVISSPSSGYSTLVAESNLKVGSMMSIVVWGKKNKALINVSLLSAVSISVFNLVDHSGVACSPGTQVPSPSIAATCNLPYGGSVKIQGSISF